MKYKKGFSLVELLVVIAIIALISTLVMSNLATARAKSRDTRRLADISNVRLALAQYVYKYGAYPQGGWNDLDTKIGAASPDKFVNTLPVDPLNTGANTYSYQSTDGSTYCIGATFETTVSVVDMSQQTCVTDNQSNNYKASN